jgi:hypothetical protein
VEVHLFARLYRSHEFLLNDIATQRLEFRLRRSIPLSRAPHGLGPYQRDGSSMHGDGFRRIDG